MEPTGLKKSNTISAKIVATPTSTAWSQAYHAGNLFAVLSLRQQEGALELNSLGKEILDTLEQEFFTLETKDLELIKAAIITTSQKIPETVSASLVIAALQPTEATILYIYGFGDAKILLKRGDAIGTILPYATSLTASSGFLQDGDVIILQTKKFEDIVSQDTLLSSFKNEDLNDVTETLAPKIHETPEGEATALMILYKKSTEEAYVAPPPLLLEEEPIPEQQSTYIPSVPKRFPISFPHLPTLPENFNHTKKLFLAIAIIVGLVLIASIFLAIKNEQNKKTQALFQELYPKASQKYEQGQSLFELNKNLARDDFEEAKKILVEGKPKFAKNSPEEKQIAELLTKVESAIEATSGTKTVQPQEAAGADESPLLQAYIKYPDALYVAQDENTVYALTNTTITSISKANKSTKNIIKNDDYWTKPGGLGTFLGNIYVLDKEEKQIFKFSSGSFTKSNYLPKENTELSDTTSIAIDGSIYVLLTNGEVRKFTKGAAETFGLTGLDKPFVKPSRIATDADASNIYILDKGNKRIVVFAKNGTYQAQYQADILKNAIDFDVREKDKKIYVLADKKVWQLDIR